MRSHHRPRLAGALLAAGLLLTGCSGLSTEPAAGDASSAGGGAAPAPEAEPGSPGEGDGSGAPGSAAQRSGKSANSHNTDNTVARGEIRDRSIIRTGRMTVRVADVRAAAGKAATLVGGTSGYVESEHSAADDDGTITSSQVVLRVEVDDYARVADELRGLGKVLSDRSESTDVTEEIVDVESRIESQEDSIARLRTLLGSAETVGQVIEVESELSVRQAELESLQSRYAVLSSQTSLSTITVDFERTEKPEEAEEAGTGFLWGLGQGWNALLGTGGALLTVVGVVMPFAVIIAIIAVPTWLLVRNRRRRPAPPAEPAPTTTGS